MSNHWLNKTFDKMIYEYWCDDFDMAWDRLGLNGLGVAEADKKFYFDHDREPEHAAIVHALSLGFAIDLETGRVTCCG